MCSLLIQQERGEWQVWIGLDKEHPIDHNGFIVGMGDTRDEAVADAVKDLEAAVARLQSGPGAVLEKEERL